MIGWIIVGTFINALALYITAALITGFEIDGLMTLLISALVIGAINTFIKPIAQILSLPLTLLTFGIFALIVNTAMIALAAGIVPSWHIDGFWPAFWGAILLSICSAILSSLIKPKQTNH
jgi:putative membrane protein